MKPTARNKRRAARRLTILREQNGGGCWVCGSISGLKTAREGWGIRCRQCFIQGKHTPDTKEFEELREFLKGTK